MSKREGGDVLADNPTRAAIAEAIAACQRNLQLDVNPAFSSLSAVLEHGVAGNVSMRFTASESTAQGNGVVGGGTLANMLDCGMAVAVLSMLKPGQTCATISLTVNMQRAANVGYLFVQAKVDRVGGRVAFSQAQLFDAERRLIANATSSLAVI